MAKVPVKKPKAKAAPKSAAPVEQPVMVAPEPPAPAPVSDVVEAPAAEQDSSSLRPPSTPVEPTHDREEEPRGEDKRGHQRDKIAASINIAKLQEIGRAHV